MPNVSLTPALNNEYENLFNTCIIKKNKEKIVEQVLNDICANKSRYSKVEKKISVPWFFVGAIHYMEAKLIFSKHLHNGDPLTDRTVHIPTGRPPQGEPPFSWEDSAIDALNLRGLGSKTDWSVAGTMYQLEGYNGWGYRLYHTHVLSPYLWSFSNHYVYGKYIADGTWSESAISKQCGSAIILRRMAEKGLIQFCDQPAPSYRSMPMIVKYSKKKPLNPQLTIYVENLQKWLNTFPGIFVKVDGIPGPFTSEAYKKVTGKYLPKDPRK